MVQIRSIFFITFISISYLSFSQIKGREIEVASSEGGNYLHCITNKYFINDSAEIKQTESFVIERARLGMNGNVKDTVYEQIGELRPVSTERELRKYFDGEQIKELIKAFKLSSAGDLVGYFQAKRSPM